MRYCYTPDLGIFTAVTGGQRRHHGPGEPAPRRPDAGSARAGVASLEDELDRLLGTAWDNELEPFRRAADGAPVRWLSAI